jgi:hypothetical protein
MRSALLIGTVTALFLVSPVVGSQDFDLRAAEQRLRDPYRPPKNLHEAEVWPDGARGYGIGNPQGVRIAPPVPPPPPFRTELEWFTFETYCRWDAIVQAILLDSTPVLTADKSLIYTVSHFAVVDTIKSDAPFTPGEHLVAYRVGGEVVDAGEKLRIATPDMAAFEPQNAYILMLQRDKSASARQYSIPMRITITVRNEKVYPIAGKYAWLTGAEPFLSGRSYAEVRNTFVRVASLQSCGAR